MEVKRSDYGHWSEWSVWTKFSVDESDCTTRGQSVRYRICSGLQCSVSRGFQLEGEGEGEGESKLPVRINAY